jgi:predicted TIM-barrel fold metal-dependent hydrolase
MGYKPERMIIDFHTHIFPPEVRDGREEYARRDSTFAEMYGDASAAIATAEDLLASMDEAGVDVSVALGFAWAAGEDISRHNDYLLEAAAASGGRIVPFATVNMADEGAEAEIERCASLGARGLGELRPENQGWDLAGEAGERLARAAERHGLVLLFHVTEPGKRTYPGRVGCSRESFLAFARPHPKVTVVGGHLGGDCYREEECPENVYVDTAAQPFLYGGEDGVRALASPPAERLMLGSDFPLIGQARQVREIQRALGDGDGLEQALGGNARRLLGL